MGEGACVCVCEGRVCLDAERHPTMPREPSSMSWVSSERLLAKQDCQLRATFLLFYTHIFDTHQVPPPEPKA